MRLPKPASPGAAARRSLLADLLAALLLAAIAIAIAAGIGVVGFVALICALLLLLWYLVERVVRLRRRRRSAPPAVRPAPGARDELSARATRPGSAERRRHRL